MREILFRGKRKDNGEWVEGYYSKEFFTTEKYDNISREEIDVNRFGEPCYRGYEVIPKTIGQYTGLRDKDGNRIFEGDIVKCTDAINGITMTAIVEFGNPNGENNWGFQLRRIHGDKANLDILLWVETETDGVYAEVIGNIHDNIKLLNENRVN